MRLGLLFFLSCWWVTAAQAHPGHPAPDPVHTHTMLDGDPLTGLAIAILVVSAAIDIYRRIKAGR